MKMNRQIGERKQQRQVRKMNHKGLGMVEVILILLVLIVGILIFRERLTSFIAGYLSYLKMGGV